MLIHFTSPQLLLADIREVVGVVVFVVMLVMWVVRQITEAKQQMGRRAPQQPAAPKQAAPAAAPPQPQQPAAAAAGQQADPLRSQVEEFLRRAKQQPPPQAKQPTVVPRAPKRVRPADIEVLLDEDSVVDERRRLAEPFRPVGQAEPARPLASATLREPIDNSRNSVAEHVQEHISASTRSLGQQTSQLGQRIVAEDHQFDVELKSRFDHSVGTLASRRTTGATAPEPVPQETPASQIAAMLSAPEGMRQAIVLNEILRRPSDRW